MFEMHKQPTILVTGISSGIGFSIAERLLKSGYFVIGTVRSLKDAEQLVSRQQQILLSKMLGVKCFGSFTAQL